MDGSGLVWTDQNAGQACWVSDDINAWIPGTISNVVNNKLVEIKLDQETVTISLDKNGHTVKRLVLPRDVNIANEGLDNMDDLTHLHEACILSNVCERFQKKLIYTRTGPILVAMNPFEWLPIYGPDTMKRIQSCSSSNLDESSPHCFVVAEKAYRRLKSDSQSQALIICGESGAGKTETTKLMLQYLSQYSDKTEDTIATRIMDSNPVMEAFGNAKTLRNNNSSRFGKFIQLEFQNSLVHGAHVSNYLLEKSRTVRQNKGERNYHVFYQLCKGANDKQRNELSLSDLESFTYLNQSGCVDVDGFNDAEDFQQTLKAMQSVGINADKTEAVLRMIAAILHIGNVNFSRGTTIEEESKDDASPVPDALETACRLLKCDSKKLGHALRVKYINVNGKAIESPLDAAGKIDLRDAMSKSIYERLFTYIVDCINDSLEHQNENRQFDSFVGILDIYGFESFKQNGFEQLLINFANEKLQSLFNEQVFQAEEKTYKLENVPFSRTDIPDNSKCLTLVNSVFRLMHDECLRMRAGSDKGLASQITQQCKGLDHFTKCGPGTKLRGTTDMHFAIQHYAGQIVYSTDGFVDKNSDTLYAHIRGILAESGCELVRTLFPKLQDQVNGRLQETVAKRFSSQVHALTETISKTGPIFVRCIKSNPELKPGKVDRLSVLRQLRHSGVVAALEMRRAGFPNRLLYKEFVLRCRVLLSRNDTLGTGVEDDQWKKLAQKLLQGEALVECKDSIACGKTKIFLRANILHKIDGITSKRLGIYVVAVQCVVRQFIAERRFKAARKAALFVQSHFRGFLARRELAEQIKALELKRQWFAKSGQCERLAKDLARCHATLEELSVVVVQDSNLGVEALSQIVREAETCLLSTRSTISERISLDAADGMLNKLSCLVEKANKQTELVLRQKQEFEELSERLSSELVALYQQLDAHDALVLESSSLFIGQDRIDGEMKYFWSVIGNFSPGEDYCKIRIECEANLHEADVALEGFSVKIAQEKLQRGTELLSLCQVSFDQAVERKQEIDQHLVRLRQSTQVVGARYRAYCRKLGTSPNSVQNLSEVIDAEDNSRRNIVKLFNLMHMPLDDTDDHSSSDSSSSDEDDEVCTDFIDIELVEDLIEQNELELNHAEEIYSRASMIVSEREKAAEEGEKARSLYKVKLMQLGVVEDCWKNSKETLPEQELLLKSSSMKKQVVKLRDAANALQSAMSVPLNELFSGTGEIDEIRSRTQQLFKRIERAESVYRKAEARLEEGTRMQRQFNETLTPAIREFHASVSVLTEHKLNRRSEIQKAMSTVEVEIRDTKKVLASLTETVPSSTLLSSDLSIKVENVIQIIQTFARFVQEEIEVAKANEQKLVDAKAILKQVSGRLGVIQGNVHKSFAECLRNGLPVHSPCSSSVQVCSISTAFCESFSKTKTYLHRAANRLSRLREVESDVRLGENEDGLVLKEMVKEVIEASEQSLSHCEKSERLFDQLQVARSEELRLYLEHEKTVDEFVEHLERLGERLGDGLVSDLKSCQHSINRYAQAVRIVLRNEDLDDEKEDDRVLGTGLFLGEDSVREVLFSRGNPNTVLAEERNRCTCQLQDLELLVEREISFALEQDKQRRDELNKRRLVDTQARAEEEHREKLFSKVLGQSEANIEKVRTLVAAMGEVCSFLCDKREESSCLEVMHQLKVVNGCLVSVENAKEKRDAVLLNMQTEHAVIQAKRLEELVFNNTKVVAERKMQTRYWSEDNDFRRHSPKVANETFSKLASSGNTLTEISQLLSLEESKFRMVESEVRMLRRKDNRLESLLSDGKASIEVCRSKIKIVSELIPPATFVALMCVKDQLLEPRDDLKTHILQLNAALDLCQRNIRAVQVFLERIKRQSNKKNVQNIRIKRRVLRFVCKE